MERLTRKNWRNLDPWEKCGQDNFCKRGCHEQGGCTKGCIVPRIYDRLAAYEELMERWKLRSIEEADRIFHRVNALGGIDLMAQYRDIGSIDHFRDLLQAEQDGRLVVLPCGTDVELVRDGYAFKADHWSHTLTAFRDAPENKSGKQIALFSTKEAETALARKGDTHETDSV